MRIEQHHRRHHHSFCFGAERLQMSWRNQYRAQAFELAYSSLSPRTSTRIRRNGWLHGLGAVLCVAGVAMTATALLGIRPLSLIGSLCLPVGLACLARVRATRIRFTVFHSRRGDVCVILDDPLHDAIVSELRQRRERQLLEAFRHHDVAQAQADQRQGLAVDHGRR